MPEATTSLSVDVDTFGTTPDGGSVERYTLSRAGGVSLSVLTYGGIVQTLWAPDLGEGPTNVVLGFSKLEDYLAAGEVYFGAIVGRYANRIANGTFSLGRSHYLSRNEGKHHLHGGLVGFDKRIWDATIDREADHVSVSLRYHSPDGEEGYPGAVDAVVTYSLTADDTVRIGYRATADADTVINLTNHSLFNLKGEGSGDILDHLLEIDADAYLPIDAELIPTGEIASVARTAMDFRSPATIGARISDGYDHNFVLSGRDGDEEPRSAARLIERRSGRTLEVLTTEPGLQLYTGNRLTGTLIGSGGRAYERFAGVALETQRFPDSPNRPNFPSTVLRAGETYRSTTELRFGISVR